METLQETRVHIRWMIRRDMSDVVAIEAAGSVSPWTEDDFLKMLRQRNCIGMVAEAPGEKVVGFMVYDMNKYDLDIISLAVSPAWRRRGVGSQMVRKLAGKLSYHRRPHLFATVRETNLPAQLFLRHHGFRAELTLKDHYDGEDAYRMAYRLAGAIVEE